MQQFPNTIQACVLFEDEATSFDQIIKAFVDVAKQRGWDFNHIESKPGQFYCTYGGPNLNITLKKIAGPANPELFRQTLASPYTRATCPDAAQAIQKTKCHVLVEVSHGALGDSPEISSLLSQLKFPRPEIALAPFLQRLNVCAELTRHTLDAGNALMVHWTQSNQLLTPKGFKIISQAEPPSLLHIHPRLIQGKALSDEECMISIVAHGAVDFLGQNVAVSESPVPWIDSVENILAFIRLATMPNGYVIPHNEIFLPENKESAYRVLHKQAAGTTPAYYELQPCYHKASGFKAPDYVLDGPSVAFHRPQEQIFGSNSQQGYELVKKWRETARMAEAAGGALRVKMLPPETKPKSWLDRLRFR